MNSTILHINMRRKFLDLLRWLFNVRDYFYHNIADKVLCVHAIPWGRTLRQRRRRQVKMHESLFLSWFQERFLGIWSREDANIADSLYDKKKYDYPWVIMVLKNLNALRLQFIIAFGKNESIEIFSYCWADEKTIFV
jgi:hypothetical protein